MDVQRGSNIGAEMVGGASQTGHFLLFLCSCVCVVCLIVYLVAIKQPQKTKTEPKHSSHESGYLPSAQNCPNQETGHVTVLSGLLRQKKQLKKNLDKNMVLLPSSPIPCHELVINEKYAYFRIALYCHPCHP